MLTSSFNDEDLGSCDQECCDGIVIRDGGCDNSAKSDSEGTFEHLISSQRERRHRRGARSRSDDEENFNKIFEFQDHDGLKYDTTESAYDKAFRLSLENPTEFWAGVGRRLSWFKPWEKVLDDSNPPFTKWFVGGMLNACYNAVDRHVENGLGQRVALIHDSPVTSSIRQITYSQLLEKVSLLAGVYANIGVKKGDRVLIYMPMIPEAIISMLAAARLGAIHSVVFGGFAARELQTRIDHVEPTVIVAANCGVEPNKIVRYRTILKEALLQSSFKPGHVIIYERPEIKLDGDKHEHTFGEDIIELDWKEVLKTANHQECTPVEANEPLYILYTSGTTDQPKGVVRPIGGHLATLAWTMHAVYGMGCPHFDFGNSSNWDNKEMDSERCYQKSSTEVMNNDHELDEKVTNHYSNSERSLHHKENRGEPLSSCKSQTVNTESKVAPKCAYLVNGEDCSCCPPKRLPRDENLKNISHQPQEMSLDVNSQSFLHNSCLKGYHLPGETKNKSIVSPSLQNYAINNQLTSGLKNRQLDDKSYSASSEVDSLDDEMLHHSISNKSVSVNRQSCNHTTSNQNEINFPQDDSLCNNKELGNVNITTSLPEVQGKHLKSTIHHSSELTITSRPMSNVDMIEQELSQSHSEQLINHSPGNVKCGIKSSCSHERHKEQSKNNHRGIKISEDKSHRYNNSGEMYNYENNCFVPAEVLKNQRCPHDKGVWWAASDMGWVVGHSYVCYAPLTAGLTSVMYEGKPDRTSDPGQYFRVIEEHGVNALLTAPTALRVIKRVDPNAVHGKKYSTKSLKTIFVAGESLDQSTKTWAERIFKVGVVNHWWQTETGHSITATFLGLGHSPDDPPGLSTGKSCPGFDLRILRDDGSEAAVGEEGRIAARLPLPPGTLSTLYKNPEKFKLLYFSTFPGYYDTMDAGYVFPDAKSSIGWIVVTGREDDVVSVAGHRLSAAAIEAVALQHPDVSDALVVGIPDCTKGEVPLCLYVPTPMWKKNGESDENAAHRVSHNLIQMVRELVGPIAAFRLAFPVPALPKTRSGKIPRRSIARMARGLPLKVPSTVEDPLVYEDIKIVLQNMRLSHVK